VTVVHAVSLPPDPGCIVTLRLSTTVAPGIGVAVLGSNPVDESTTTPRNSPFAFGSVAATLITAPDQSDVFEAGALVESEHAAPSSAATAPMTNLV
jgi:hypothetical protein